MLHSYTDNESGFRTTQSGYTADLHSAMVQFYQIFMTSSTSPLYIGGSSYAGKYVPALAHSIHVSNMNNDTDLPLAGIYLGGPFFAPEPGAYGFIDFKLSLGYISQNQAKVAKQRVKAMYDRFRNGVRINLWEIDTILLDLQNAVHEIGWYNFVKGHQNLNRTVLNDILNDPVMQKGLHTGCTTVDLSRSFTFEQVKQIYEADVLVNTSHQMEELLNNYKVLVYNGEYDVITSTRSVDAQLSSLTWDHADEYSRSNLTAWYSRTTTGTRELRGFFSRTRDFCRVIVHKAGHKTMGDNPSSALDMMLQFIEHGCLPL